MRRHFNQEFLYDIQIEPKLSLVKSPVVLVVNGQETAHSSGDELLNLTFEKRYMVESVATRENTVVVTLKENDQSFNINWIGEEVVSFT